MSRTRTGSYRLAEQIGGWAVYADVTVSIVTRSGEGPLVTLDSQASSVANAEYLAAIQFGVNYALACIPDSTEFKVNVQRLHTNPADTTSMALAFATCHAVLNCFDDTPDNVPYFDRDTRSFAFPGRGPTH